MPRAVDGATQAAVDTLQAKIAQDPDIQTILTQNAERIKATHDKGGRDQDFQNRIRDQITNIAKQKGYVPKQGQYFINPNDGQLEPHGGWSGLAKKTKGILIALAAVATGGIAAAAMGGGAAAAGAAGAAGSASGAGGGAAVGGGLLASSSIPTASLMAGAPAITAGGVSSGVAAGVGGGLAASSLPVSSVMGGPAATSPGGVSACIPICGSGGSIW